jgi:large subunit ribosomal protein L17
MRHNSHVKHFGRQSGPRKALFRGLVEALVEHGRIKTTLAKAKELRRHVEKAITLGRDGSLSSYRLLLSRYPNKSTVDKIVKDIAPRFKSRAGGYTRIMKLGSRAGDAAGMAFIEFVDFVTTKSDDKATIKVRVRGADRKLVTKEMTAAQKLTFDKKQKSRAEERKKKRLRKIREASRKANR